MRFGFLEVKGKSQVTVGNWVIAEEVTLQLQKKITTFYIEMNIINPGSVCVHVHVIMSVKGEFHIVLLLEDFTFFQSEQSDENPFRNERAS